MGQQRLCPESLIACAPYTGAKFAVLVVGSQNSTSCPSSVAVYKALMQRLCWSEAAPHLCGAGCWLNSVEQHRPPPLYSLTSCPGPVQMFIADAIYLCGAGCRLNPVEQSPPPRLASLHAQGPVQVYNACIPYLCSAGCWLDPVEQHSSLA